MTNITYRNIGQKIFALVQLTALISGSLISASAQARNKGVPSQPATKQKCTGGWKGVITYRKTLSEGLNQKVNNITSGTTHHVTSREYKYEGRIILQNSSNPRVLNNKATVSLSDIDKKYSRSVKRDTCFYDGKGMRDQWGETNDSRVETAEGQGEAQLYLNYDEGAGTYSFNFRLPDAVGTTVRESKTTRGGFCQPRNNEPSNSSSNLPYKEDGGGHSIDEQKVDPESPNVLSGSKTWDSSSATVKSFIYSVTWTFTRCPQDLLITDLRFEHANYPNYGDWEEISEQTGTIDGNQVKLKARVTNLGSETKFAQVFFKETYKGDLYNGARPDLPLRDADISVRLEPGEDREVEMEWDSSGHAWFDDGRPRSIRKIKAEVWEDLKLKDNVTKILKVSPKPLILVPGVWSNVGSFQVYQNLLTLSHSYDWKAYIFGENGSGAKKEGGFRKSVYDDADALAGFVEKARDRSNAWHVDIVGHSTGGLVARLLIHKHLTEVPDGRPPVMHFMMLGTPNMGVPCADALEKKDVFPDMEQAARELQPEEMERFNQFVNNRKGAKFSALIGNSFPILCARLGWNDGFVSVESAKFGLEDFALTKTMHPGLVEQSHFGGFILPHVVTGPLDTYPLPVTSEPGGNDGRTARR